MFNIRYLQTKAHIHYYFLSIMILDLPLHILPVFSFTLENTMRYGGCLIYALDFLSVVKQHIKF